MPSPRHAPPSPFQEALWGFSCFLWSLWRAPKEQLAGCQQWGPLKGARWRMLGAKKCKQVDPLHYMGPPLHSHTPPSTVFFYVAVFHTHIYTVKHTQTHMNSTTNHCFFFRTVCFLKLSLCCRLLDEQAHKQHPTFPQDAFFTRIFHNIFCPSAQCVLERKCMCKFVRRRFWRNTNRIQKQAIFSSFSHRCFPLLFNVFLSYLFLQFSISAFNKKDLIYNSAIAHYVMFYISFSSLEGVRVEVQTHS